MNFKSIKDLSEDIRRYLIHKLPTDIGTVYGVPRSGMLPASIIATLIGSNLGMLTGPSFAGERKSKFIKKKGDKVLLVDDSVYTGSAISNAKQMLGMDCLTCTIYVSPQSTSIIDYYCLELPGPRMFEWNFTGIKSTESYMFDMDGVICKDPTAFDDDGPNYRNDIINLKPLYIPHVKIHSICTNRIERWRPETEDWLTRHGVHYGELIMQPFDTAVERRQKSHPGEYKAYHYSKSNASLFVESHDWQAGTIANKSNKPVLSIESMKLF